MAPSRFHSLLFVVRNFLTASPPPLLNCQRPILNRFCAELKRLFYRGIVTYITDEC